MNMNKVRYKRDSDGRVVYYWNPSKSMRDSIDAQYYQSVDPVDVQRHISDTQNLFWEYKRKLKSKEWVDGNSVAALIVAYRKTSMWANLSANSKRIYNYLLNSILWDRFADHSKPMAEVLSTTIDFKYAESVYMHCQSNISKHHAAHVCKVLRIVWGQGIRLGIVKSNPFLKMGIKQLPPRTVMWTPEQVELAIKTADKMGYNGLGTLILLCYDLCQRPGDMRQLTWDNFDGNHLQSPYIDMAATSLNFRQEKTGVPIKVIVSEWLQDRLSKTIRRNDCNFIVINDNPAQRRYVYKNYHCRRLYNNHLAIIRKEAGLPDKLKMSDLRRTGATEMAESGCTNAELRSVTGHKTMDVLSIYVRQTDKLAATGQSKRYAKRNHA
tara:strand:- start:1659 stop:2801 length:1143 start_codon:yes stop_codon:yes gene_type:complete